jgi:hypothetical protein
MEMLATVMKRGTDRSIPLAAARPYHTPARNLFARFPV